jgi:hypothetical protein
MINSWTLDIQRQITDNFMVDLAYAGKESERLILPTDANPARYIPGVDAQGNPLSTPSNVNARRPYASLGIAQVRDVGSYGRGSFNALEFSTEYRLKRGLSFHTAYTWSHALDISSTYSVGSMNEQSADCLNCEKGNADFNLPHVFLLELVYDLPTPFRSLQGGGGKAARGVLGAWEISTVTRLTSGTQFTCFSGTGNSLNGLGNDRCNTIAGQNWQISGGRSNGAKVTEWFNTAAFTTNPVGTLGTTGKNYLRGPHSQNCDIALMKNFPISDRYGKLQFRAEFFNAFNFVNLGTPNDNMSSPATFGHIYSAGSPRLIQMAMKFMW